MRSLDFDVLVNKEHPLEYMNYEPEDLIALDNNTNNFHNYVDPNLKPCISMKIYKPYKELEKESIKDGLHLVVDSGYRSRVYQMYVFRSILEKYYEEYVKEGCTNPYLSAYRKTCSRVALPGRSEHQTGYAVDMASYRNGVFFDDLNPIEKEWLSENAYRYGFILRYPQGKEEITGFDYEPWHYRYVGNDIAALLYNNGEWLTLEEYHKELKLTKKEFS